MFSHTFVQPLELVIVSSDGSSIDCLQQTCSREIRVLIKSKVKVTIKDPDYNNWFTPSFNNLSIPLNLSCSIDSQNIVPDLHLIDSVSTIKSSSNEEHFLPKNDLSLPGKSESDQLDSSETNFDCVKGDSLSEKCPNDLKIKTPSKYETLSVFIEDKVSSSVPNSEDEIELDSDSSKSCTDFSSSDDEKVTKKRPENGKNETIRPHEGRNSLNQNCNVNKDPFLTLLPKVHVLRLPDSVAHSKESASNLDKLYSRLSEEVFKKDINFIHRHVNCFNRDDESDEDSLPYNLTPRKQPINDAPITSTVNDFNSILNLNSVSLPIEKYSFLLDSGSESVEEDSGDKPQKSTEKQSNKLKQIDSEDDDHLINCQVEMKENQGLTSNSADKLTDGGFKRRRLNSIQTMDELSESGTFTSGQNIASAGNEPILSLAELKEETIRATSSEQKRIERLIEQEEKYSQLVRSIDGERLVLDFDDNGNSRVEVKSILVKEIKSHQIEGIKFLYNSTIENVGRLQKGDKGSGCILAHCMGLGKTFQTIALVHTILSNSFTKDHIKTVLIAAPVNVLKNWVEEFDKWIVKNKLCSYEVFETNDEITMENRLICLNRWHEKGGVLIIGHHLLGSLLNIRDNKKISMSEMTLLRKNLVDPGPDMIIIDEGHILRSSNLLSKGIVGMRTRRKILLTGTPLQNNLDEYYTMIDIIKPRLLGSKKEFAVQFRLPIENGQKADSNDKEFQLMKERESVLHKLLSSSIQRYGSDTLKLFLAPKIEFALFIRPTPTIAKMYNYFLDNVKKERRVLFDACYLRLLVNHPAIYYLQEAKEDNKRQSTSQSKSKPVNQEVGDTESKLEIASVEKDWYKQFIKPQHWTDIHRSNKFGLFLKILSKCISCGDKLVVASQSIETLDLIEKLVTFQRSLSKSIPHLAWKLGKNYFRIDGTINANERLEQVKKFNDPKNTEARLFLLSTRAGGIGINLTGANRCIIFDVSWNPSDDIQAICRVYRMGQTKPVYVYRFVTKDTMEEQIFRKQVLKLGMAIRVVDKQQVKRASSTCDPDEFYGTRPKEKYQMSAPDVSGDCLLVDIFHSGNIGVMECTELDSFLKMKPEEELTEEERQVAWDEYQRKRKTEFSERPAQEWPNIEIVHASLSHENLNKSRLEEVPSIQSISSTTEHSPISSPSTCPTSEESPVPETSRSSIHKSVQISKPNALFDKSKRLSLSKFDFVYIFQPTRLMARMYNFFLDRVQKDKNLLFSHSNYLRLCVNHPAIYQLRDNLSQPDGNSLIKGTSINSDWYKQFVHPDDCTKIDLSGKFVMLFSILDICITFEDKLVVISQSIETLDFIESLLPHYERIQIRNRNRKFDWEFHRSYFRIDNGTCVADRIKQIRHFNDPENKVARLFLLSSKAGGVGMDLIFADRVIIFDVFFNLNYDIQAIWQVLQQKEQNSKPVILHRFVTKGTMEEQIFRKQILKLGLTIRGKQLTKRFPMTYESDEFYNNRLQEHYTKSSRQFSIHCLLNYMYENTTISTKSSASSLEHHLTST